MACDKEPSLSSNCAADLFRQVGAACCDSYAFDGRISHLCGGELAAQYCTRLRAQGARCWRSGIDQPDCLAFHHAGHWGKRVHKMAAPICGLVGVMGWLVWSVGVLPSVNGFCLGPREKVRMTLMRTQITPVSRSRAFNHWAWLRPEAQNARAEAGRYFISVETYQRWNEQQPSTVTVTIAPGLLGAQVVTGFD